MQWDLVELIKAVGYLGIFGIIFAETGLLVGAFLPGDSLLFTAGFLASQGFLNIGVLILGCGIAAVVGDSVGYMIGFRYGRRLFERDESRFFKRKHLIASEAFYAKHGGKTIILARFLPFVRTFAPTIAGVARMPYRRFLLYNVIGALLWAVGLPLAGYVLGSTIPDIDNYLIPIILLIIVISVLPTAIHIVAAHREEVLRLLRLRRRTTTVEAEKAQE